MKRIGVTAFLLMFFLTSSYVSATTFYHAETIKVGDHVKDVGFDDANLIVMHDNITDKIAFYNTQGNFLKSFDTSANTAVGMTYNGSRGTIVFGQYLGDNIGRLYEMNPDDGTITGPVIEGTSIQPYLAYTGSLILSSWRATGLDGVLNIPIDRYNATNYDYVDTISITIDTGTDVDAISRVPIAYNNGYLYLKLAAPGFAKKIYEYNPDLTLSEITELSDSGLTIGIDAMSFLGNDLLVICGGTNDIYRYSPIPPEHLLSVSKQGTGMGNVLSSPPGINCGAYCNASFIQSTTVNLTATPDVNSVFTHWSGGCIGATEVCTIIMTDPVTVTAHFLSHALAYDQWKSITPPVVSDDWSLNSIHFTSPDEGWVVGRDWKNKRGILLLYKNGIWTTVTPPVVSNDWYLNSIHFTSPDEGWAVGTDNYISAGVLLHYQSGIWTTVTPPAMDTTWELSSVHFTSPDEGWAVGWDNQNGIGVLLHYQNGIWTTVTPPVVGDWIFSGWELSSVYFTSPDEGWAAGRDYYNGAGVLLLYKNGIWTTVTPPVVSNGYSLNSIHFTSPDEGWAVGSTDNYISAGVLLHYQNGIWTTVTPPAMDTTWELSSVHFTSPDEGWAVGGYLDIGGGILLHYQNGTWTTVTHPAVSSDWFLNGVHFTSPDEGWAVGLYWTTESTTRGSLLHFTRIDMSLNEGTIGTQIRITGPDFGTKKGKVIIGGIVQTVNTWTPTSISVIIKKAPFMGTHDLTIIPYKADDILLPDAFTVRPPEIASLDNYQGAAGTPITISGNFFGTKKGKVYLEVPGGKPKSCKVTSWGMNSITFKVPKSSRSFPPGTYPLKVTNKVGTAYAPSSFTVN